MAHQFALADVLAEIAKRLEANKIETVPPLLFPTLDQHPGQSALWYYAGIYFQRAGINALAALCWEHSYRLDPQAQVLIGIGAILKDTGRPAESRAILKRALEVMPEGDLTLYTNLVGCHVNEGIPEPGIEYGERAIAEGKFDGTLLFNLALLHLEAGHYARGFDLYAEGTHKWRDKRSYEGAEKLTPENFEAARGKRLVVYGEQGIGDELMYATMLEQATRDFQVIFDSHPRLQGLHASSPWNERLIGRYATRKTEAEWYQPGMADFYTPIGNLGRFYRRNPEDFAWRGPYYEAPAEDVAFNRHALTAMAEGRKLIGVAFRGGSIKTMRNYRVVPPKALDALFRREDVAIVNLDYEDVTNIQEWMTETYGPDKMLWFPSINWAWEYHHFGALMAALDGVVSVCQSAAHLSAAMGLPTYVLAPSRPAWRYGLTSSSWYWYPHDRCRIYRQQGEDWAPAIEAMLADLDAYPAPWSPSYRVAEPEAAA